ncbi:MAG: exosome complex protein Rrp42 [Nanoarchaeota archaeon]
MNEELKETINESLKQGYRQDGRQNEEYRKIEIELDVIQTAEGSARVKCGDTEVIAGVKLSVGTPFPDQPEDGVLMVGAELLPLSNPDFESGPPSIESIEVARVIDRGIRESKVIDTRKLCITKGEKVWLISVDICPINTDGNLIDVGALATIAALKSTTFPEYEDKRVDYKKKTKEKLPMKAWPITVTVVKIGDNYLIDPTEAEEKALDARLTAAFTADGKLCALQKGGDSPLLIQDIDRMIDLAQEKSHELRKLL